MSKISKSPDRHSFQKTGYVNRQLEKGEPINQNYLDMFDRILEEEENKFDDPKSRENNLEYDLLTTDWILEKVRKSEVYAQNLYAAMCNRDFQKLDVMPILKNETWSRTWRYAGGIVASMQQKGDYIDWYCSGIRDLALSQEEVDNLSFEEKERYLETQAYVSEGVVTQEIENDLKKLGWLVLDQDLDNY
jgi:hypothetical protein